MYVREEANVREEAKRPKRIFKKGTKVAKLSQTKPNRSLNLVGLFRKVGPLNWETVFPAFWENDFDHFIFKALPVTEVYMIIIILYKKEISNEISIKMECQFYKVEVALFLTHS